MRARYLSAIVPNGPRTTLLRFQFKPTNSGLAVETFCADVGGCGFKPIQSNVRWLPLAAILLHYRISMAQNPSYSQFCVALDSMGAAGSALVKQAWNIIKNHLNKTPSFNNRQLDDELLSRIHGMNQRGAKPKSIEIDPKQLPPSHISFSVEAGLSGQPIGLTSPAQWQAALAAITSADGIPGFLDLLQCPSDAVSRPQAFSFGPHLTKTYVAHFFPDGVYPEVIECHRVNEDYEPPAELRHLIDEACAIVARSSLGTMKEVNASICAPIRVERVINYDAAEGSDGLRLWLADSHYNWYTAAAYAEELARRNSKFRPLLDFVQRVTNPQIPSPASCSIGTRIIVETNDRKFVACYRSRACKMNADMWSVSANEGVRPGLLKRGVSFGRLVECAARQALANELRIDDEAITALILVSVHQNSYAQWGASFYANTSLTFGEVEVRQPLAPHRHEHRRIAALPVDIDACGPAMAELGPRWYGGALETICSALSFKALDAHGGAFAPEDVGAMLSAAAKHTIIPLDEINSDFLKMSA
jgi:hypothetical protein